MFRVYTHVQHDVQLLHIRYRALCAACAGLSERWSERASHRDTHLQTLNNCNYNSPSVRARVCGGAGVVFLTSVVRRHIAFARVQEHIYHARVTRVRRYNTICPNTCWAQFQYTRICTRHVTHVFCAVQGPFGSSNTICVGCTAQQKSTQHNCAPRTSGRAIEPPPSQNQGYIRGARGATCRRLDGDHLARARCQHTVITYASVAGTTQTSAVPVPVARSGTVQRYNANRIYRKYDLHVSNPEFGAQSAPVCMAHTDRSVCS